MGIKYMPEIRYANLIKKFLPLGIAILIVFNGISTAKTIMIENEREPEFEATGFIHVEKDENGIWWFVNSTGHKFYYTSPGPSFANEYYYCRFRLKHQSIVNGKGWNHERIPDVFDPWWQNITWNATQKYAKPLRNDPNILGYYLDNEMKWGPDTSDDLTMLDVYMGAENNTPGKQRLISFLKERYDGNVNDFNKVWNMEITTFDDLNDTKEFGIKEGWRIRSQLRFAKQKLFRDYPFLKEEPYLFEKAEKDLEDFSRLVAETYFKVTNTALKAADPNHLNLGVRFHYLGVPQEVLNESGKYCDVISINHYRDGDIGDIVGDLISKQYGCVPLISWMKEYNQETGKPLFVSEYGFQKVDRITSLQPFHPGPPKLKRTEYARANAFEWYVRNSFKRPYMVGHHFFDNIGDPNGPLYKRLVDLNSRANELHEKASLNSICSVEDYSSYDLLITHLFKNEQQESANSYPAYKSTLLTQYVPAEWKYNHNVKNYGKTIYVDDDNIAGPWNGTLTHPYLHIQDAIDNASKGDKIFVHNGTYDEKIMINKSNLIIEGENENNTVLGGFFEDFIFLSPDFQKPNNYVINVVADNITICGFNITTKSGIYIDSCGGLRACKGILITDTNNSAIINNTFSLLTYGIDVINGSNTKIFNNHNSFEVKLKYANDSEIRNNDLTEIRILKSNDCTIKNNYIPGGKVELEEAHNNLISDNTILKTGKRGIFLSNSNNNCITFNNFIEENLEVDILSVTLKPLLKPLENEQRYETATFLNSNNNKWDHNYWSRSRIFPKIIVGRKGKEGFIPAVNFDWHPAKNPHKI